MTPAQLKAMLAKGITEFAIHVIPIDRDITRYHIPPSYATIKSCPTGLRKATVIEDAHKWVEQYTFGCGGDQVHETPRRNGVLVEFEAEPMKKKNLNANEAKAYDKLDGEAKAKFLLDASIARWKNNRLVTVEDEKIRLVVSRRAIAVPWGEYALVEAEREKVRVEAEARYAKLSNAADALGIPEPTDKQRHTGFTWSRYEFSRDRSLPNNKREWKAEHKAIAEQAHIVEMAEVWRGDVQLTAFFGTITMPLDHAEKLARVLDFAEQAAGELGVKEMSELIGQIKGQEVS